MLEVKRPPLASTGYYVNSRMDGLESVYRPHQSLPKTLPADFYALPVLEVSKKAETPLVVKIKPSHSYYDMTKHSAKGWQSCQFYEYLKSRPEDQPDTVGITEVNRSDTVARDPKLSKNLLLRHSSTHQEDLFSHWSRCGSWSRRTAYSFNGLGNQVVTYVDKMCFPH